MTGTVEANGAQLWFESAGSGPPVVLLHAGIADARMWDGQMDAFSAGYHVVRYDARGYGRSTLPGGPYAHADDLAVLLDHLGLDRVALIGCSMGGSSELQFGLEHPDRVGALVFVGSGLDDHTWSSTMDDIEKVEEAAFERGDEDGVVEVNLRTWVVGPGREPEALDPQVRERADEMLRTSFRTQLAAYALDPEPGPSRKLDPPGGTRLAEIVAPTLVLAGTADVPDILAIARKLAEQIPDAELRWIEDAAHLPNLERPEEFDELVLGFLARAWPSGG
jgi:pimeloyl-ACP methyl ester carboxylesterase